MNRVENDENRHLVINCTMQMDQLQHSIDLARIVSTKNTFHGIRSDKRSTGRNKVEHNGINSEHKVPLRPHRVEGRGDAIVIDVDRSFDLSAAIRARASRCVPSSRPGNLHIPINYVLLRTQIAGNLHAHPRE